MFAKTQNGIRLERISGPRVTPLLVKRFAMPRSPLLPPRLAQSAAALPASLFHRMFHTAPAQHFRVLDLSKMRQFLSQKRQGPNVSTASTGQPKRRFAEPLRNRRTGACLHAGVSLSA
jgi:hypothetical protein